MLRRTMRLIAGGAVLALALGLTGCGDSKKGGDPKVDSPNAPKIDPNAKGAPSKPKGNAE